jgi:glycosyltransferase involved in cell wall biosynthesis
MTADEHPFFSVVMPVYNKAAYVAASVRSVLEQSFRDFELLLVVDKSTDDSEAIVEGFTDARIRVFKRDTPGPGGYAARNLGIAEARAPWIAFLDADDSWQPDFLKHIHDAIQHQVAIQVFCTAYHTGSATARRPNIYHRKFSASGSHVFDFQRFLLHKPIHTSSVVIRKQLLDETGGFPAGRFNRGGDSETWLRIMQRSRAGFWVNYFGAHYDNEIAGSVIKANASYLKDHPVRLKVLELLAETDDPTLRRALKRHANSFILPGLRSQGRASRLSPKHFGALFPDTSLLRKQIVLMFGLSFLPSFVQRFLMRRLQANRSGE